ncbi:polysaccharide biosynthesis C-terminal domain-containing protein [[Pseudomonas] boreopolis]|uniref:oligosaccharide flippase family protein n=1 Tax=Xanthomonas boreopolis TaxID=86183 RepID=UPI003D586076
MSYGAESMNRDRSSNTILSGVFRVFFRQISNIVLGVAITAVVARALGPEGNGVFVFLTVLVPPLLVAFAGFGVIYSGVYYVARGDIDLRSGYHMAVAYWLLLSPIGCVIGYLYSKYHSDSYISDTALWISISSFPFLLLQTFLTSLIQAKQEFGIYSRVTLVPSAVTLVLLAVLFLLFGVSIVNAVIAYAAAQIVSAGYSLWVVKGLVSSAPRFGAKIDRPMWAYAKYGFFSYLGNLMAFALVRVNYYFVGHFLGGAALGVFAIASQMSDRLLLLVTSVTTVALPKLSASYGAGDGSAITSLMTRMTIIASMCVAILVGISSPIVIRVLFGEDYMGALVPLLVLLPSTVFTSVSRIIANDLSARGLPYLNVSTSVFVVLGNVLLCWTIIPTYGLLGASLATSITAAVNCLLKLEVYRRVSGSGLWEPIHLRGEDFKAYYEGACKLIGRMK